MAGAEPLYLMEGLPEGESFILDYNRRTTEALYRRGFYEHPKTNLNHKRILHHGERVRENGWDFIVNRAGYITDGSSGKLKC